MENDGRTFRHGEVIVELRNDDLLYKCLCTVNPPLFTGINCNASAEDAHVYVADNNKLVKIAIGDVYGFKKNFIRDLPGQAVALDMNINKNLIYWSDVSHTGRGIYRAGLSDGSRITRIISEDIYEPNGIAVDWLANNIYWTDAQLGAIFVAKDNGRDRVRLIGGLAEPRGLVVLPRNGLMFWTDQSSGTIERSRMDGSDHQVLVTNLQWPNELTVDYNSRRVFWIDGKTQKIESSDLDGNNFNVIYSFGIDYGNSPGYGLTYFNNRLYFSIWGQTSLFSINSNGGGDKRRVVTSLSTRAMGVGVVNEQLQRNTRYTNPCWTNLKGGCSHLCLPTSYSTYTCACPSNTGLVLARDATNCVVPNNFILSTSLDEGTIMLTSLDPGSPRTPVVLAQAHQPSAVDYDPIDQMVYWSDVGMNGIYRKPLNVSAPELFLQDGIGTVDGIAVDWENRHLYFTNVGWSNMGFPYQGSTTRGTPYHRIEMVGLRGGNKRKILTSSGLDRPRDIVIDTSAGMLIVSDWGNSPKVVQFDLDGQNPQELTVNVENPNGLALHNGTLYITDSHYTSGHVRANGTIVYHRQPTIMRYDTIRKTSTELTDITMEVPFGLTYHQGSLFFADWGLGGIYEVNMGLSGSGERGAPFVVGVKKPTGVKFATNIVQRSRMTQNVCSPQRTQCSDVCVPVDGGYSSCLCPDVHASVLSENLWNCVEPDQFLLIADGSRIILKSIQPPDHYHYPVIRTFDELSNIVAVTFDPVSKFVYWADNGRQRISRKSISGVNAASSIIEVVHSNIGQVEGMAIDPDNRLLYWTDRMLGSIEMLYLDGMIHTVVLLGLENPRSIVLNPGMGIMYWTEGGNQPQVLSSRMNGQDSRVMLSEGLTWPNGLSFDPTSGVVYVADGGRLIVRSVPDEGQIVMKRFNLNGTAGHVFGLGKLEDSLYFTDWKNHTLMSLDDRRTNVVITDLIRPTHIHVQPTYSIRGSTGRCSSRLPRCSHICIPDQSSSVCLCPVGKVLAPDMHSCVTEEELFLMTSTTAPATTTTTIINETTTTTPPWADLITAPAATVPTTTEPLIPIINFHQDTTVAMVNETTTVAMTTIVTTQAQTTMPPPPRFLNCNESATYPFPLPEGASYITILPSMISLEARDGIGRRLNITMVDLTNRVVSSIRFMTSQYMVVLRAEDKYNRTVECEVNIRVTDTTKPTITTPCPDDIMVEIYPGQSRTFVPWTRPQFVDNSGNAPFISSNREPGYFGKGIHNVTYTAIDGSDNSESCSFSVVVNEINPTCGSPFIPRHSQLTCATNIAGIQTCQISCMNGYRLTLSDPKIICHYNQHTRLQEWLPYLDHNVCKRPDVGNIRQDVGVQYPSPCRASAEFYDSRSNELASSLMRYRGCRNSSLKLGLCEAARDKLYIQCIQEEKLNVTVTVDLANARLAGSTSEARRVIRSASTDIIDMISRGDVTTTGYDERVYAARMESVTLTNEKIICDEGYIEVEDGCVQCPAGTYWKLNKCEFCPIHFYQNLAGKSSCIECSPIKGTYFYGTTSVQYCVVMDRNSSPRTSPLPITTIIGGAVGGFLLLLAIMIVVCFWRRRKANNKIKREQEVRRRQAEEAKAKKQIERRKRNGSTNQSRRSRRRGSGGEMKERIRSLDSDRSGNQQSRKSSERGSSRGVPTATVPAVPRGKSPGDGESLSRSEIGSVSSKVDASTVAESSVFTDAETTVSTEMPLKSALKKTSRAPPVAESYLEDDTSTVMTSSTLQPSEIKQLKQRRLSLDDVLEGSHVRGNPNRRSMSMKRPTITPRSIGMPARVPNVRRSNSLDRTPNPRMPRLNPNQRMMMPRSMGPMVQYPQQGGIPHRPPGPMYGGFGPRRMPPPGVRYPPHVPHRFSTLRPGKPRYPGYWNDGFASDSDWDSVSMRSESDRMQQPRMMPPSGMRPRFRMDGMRSQMPNMGVPRVYPAAPPPYYTLQR
nr:uncharacterized protein LOC100176236 isoform X1 [Ciona intestinalis]|eukprot:XP_002125537.4 uncharacterized protein LOC100176236 isoform X1 [Ciona intestinalis]